MIFDKQKAPSQGSVTVTVLSDDTNRTAPEGSQHGAIRRLSNLIATATPAALLCAYLVFSIGLYSLLAGKANTAFWFVYITAATLLSITTVLEVYDGFTPLREGRKIRAKLENDGTTKLAHGTNEESLEVECIFVGVKDGRGDQISHWSNLMVRHYPEVTIRTTMLAGFGKLAQHLVGSAAETKAPLIALFSAHELPHPDAVILASQRLLKDKAIDIVQGRRILASHENHSPLTIIATFQQDLHSALICPGRCSIWNLPISTGSGTYWRTEALVAACANLSSLQSSWQDLAFSAYRNGVNCAHDLALISYTAGPISVGEFFNMQVDDATQFARTAYTWTKLAFLRKPKIETTMKRTWKSRIGLLRSLPVELLAAHMIMQFFSLVLAQLITQTPRSSLDVANLVHWRSAYSQWMILSGIVAMAMLVVMTFKARSEFLSMWNLPFALLSYPVVAFLSAGIGLYGQLRCMVQGVR